MRDELEIESGDYIEGVDQQVEKWREQGYTAEYKNLMSSVAETWTVIGLQTDNADYEIYVTADMTGTMVKKVDRI